MVVKILATFNRKGREEAARRERKLIIELLFIGYANDTNRTIFYFRINYKL